LLLTDPTPRLRGEAPRVLLRIRFWFIRSNRFSCVSADDESCNIAPVLLNHRSKRLYNMIRSVRIRCGLLKPAASRFSAALPKQHLSSLQFSDVLSRPTIANSVALEDRTRDIQLTYAQLNDISSKLASKMAAEDLRKPFSAVGAFNKPSVSFVISMLAAWKLGKVFVPLSTTHTENELGYFIEDSKVGLVCCASKDMVNAPFLASLNLPLLETDSAMRAIGAKSLDATEREALKPFLRGADSTSGSVKGDTPALVIYTSGTTGRPKGVLHTHSSIYNMTTSLVQSWQYTEHDKILHFLPLYHVHGLVNKLLCMLYSGATVEFTGSAAAPTLWKRLAQEEHDYQSHVRDAQHGATATYKPVSLFMAVPTVYARLLESSYEMRHDPVQAETLAAGVRALKRMRLMVCGSAALPDNVLQNWQKLTGYKLLERYGMTEIGMALSNPYEGERRQGEGFLLSAVVWSASSCVRTQLPLQDISLKWLHVITLRGSCGNYQYSRSTNSFL
jgi:acyl-CoA synthetase (AMP-forming)/AMP-acid ligase II